MTCGCPCVCVCPSGAPLSVVQAEDFRMREIMHMAHEFLQKFCSNNYTNQGLLHRHIELFLSSGDSVSCRLWSGWTTAPLCVTCTQPPLHAAAASLAYLQAVTVISIAMH